MEFVKLKALCEFEKGSTGLAKAETGDYPLVTTGAARKSCNSYQFDTKAVCIPLVSSTGHGHASLKNVHYQEGKFALGTILVALTSKDDNRLDIQFLHLYLSQLKDQVLVPLMSGAANVALSVKKIQDVEIPLPSIDRQREIVQRFKSIVREEDELKSELTRQQIFLKKLRQQILQEAIEGKLTADWRAKNLDGDVASELLKRIASEKAQLVKDKKIKAQKSLSPISDKEKPFELPLGWQWCRLDQVIYESPKNGYSPKTVDFPTSTKTLKLGATTSGKFIDTEFKYVDEKTPKDSPLWIKNREILIQRGNSIDFVGVSAIYYGEEHSFIYPDLMMKLKPAASILETYLHHALMSTYCREYFRKNSTGTQKSMPKINQATVSSALIPLCSEAEQQAIVTKVGALLTLCDQLEAQISQNQSHAEQLMQVVLKEAFSYNSATTSTTVASLL